MKAPSTTVDEYVSKDTGLSWPEVDRFNNSQHFGGIYDGSSHTILFGESIRKTVISGEKLSGFELPANYRNWSESSVNNCAFIYPVVAKACEASNFASPPQPEGTTGNPNAAPHGAPFLSSDHPGLVNVAMADGSVRPIVDEVDRAVYRSLVTAGGTRLHFEGFQQEAPVSEF